MSTIILKAQINDVIHYTMRQNHIPIIENLVLMNESSKDYNSLSVHIIFNPDFVVMKEIDIQTLEKGNSIMLTPITLVPSMEYLLSLQEIQQGMITIIVKDKENELYRYTQPITILAYDTWLGMEKYKELIAAYCTPNYLGNLEIVEQAKKFLSKSKSKEFTGYIKNNEDIVIGQMNAIYNAIQEYELELTTPNKLNNSSYQKLRFADTILEDRYATSLEIALLFAGCLERVALNPILVFLEEHVVVGCWLKPETFKNKVETDIKLLQLNGKNEDQFCFIDSQDVVMNAKTEFWQSQLNANKYLNKYKRSLSIIDIKCCRMEGIHAMPMSFGNKSKNDDRTDYQLDIEAEWNSIYHKRTLLNQALYEDKKKLWEDQLIDMGNHNDLVNFKESYHTVQIITVNLFELQEELSSEEQFTLVPHSKFMTNLTSGRSLMIGKDHAYIEAYVTSEFRKRNIPTCLSDDELTRYLKHIYRQTRRTLEETGANSLYLALGFLRWYEKQEDQQERYAPLVLLPVEMNYDIEKNQYKLGVRDEDAVLNHTLFELLQKEYEIHFEGINQLPQDECGIDLSYVFKSIRKGIEDLDRWEVEEAAFVGLFSHDQYLLWKDYKGKSDKLHFNKVSSSLLNGRAEWKPQNITALDRKQITPVILADNTQIDAIAMANKGESFVLHAPLGSGKSQTITNILAELMSKGKKVLVLGKKEASLLAIRQELSRLKLDPYVLCAFSEYAKKKELLEQINIVLRETRERSNIDYEETIQELTMMQDNMDELLNAVHRKREYGMSFYQAFIQYEKYRKYKDQLKIDDTTIARMKEGDYENWVATVEQCKYARKECLHGVDTMFSRYQNTEYSMEIRSSFVGDCKELIDELTILDEQYNLIKELLGINVKLGSYFDYKTVLNLLEMLKNTCYQLDEVMLVPCNESKEKLLYEVIRCGKEKIKLEEEIKLEFSEEIFEYDAMEAVAKWKETMHYWLFKRYVFQMHQVNELRQYSNNPKNIVRSSIQFWLAKLSRYKKLITYIEELPASITSQFSYIWQGINTDWDKLEAALADTIKLRDALEQLNLERNVYISVSQKFNEIISNQDKEKEKSTNDQLIDQYKNSFSRCMMLEMRFLKLYHADLEYFHNSNEWITSTKQELLIWTQHNIELRDWSQYLKQLDILRQLGFANVADLLHNGELKIEDVVESFICNVNLAILKRIMQAEPILNNNQGACLEQQIERYIALTNTTIQNVSIKLGYELSAKIKQNLNNEELVDGIALLKKAIKTGGKMQDIRCLFDQNNQVIKMLFPCMIMSPAIAAKYFSTAYSEYDYVIVDDADMIETCEVVSALTKANNVIVVGDMGQSNIESMYEDCVTIGMVQNHLRWQYEAEETITEYRNRAFYNEQLKSFPSINQSGQNLLLDLVDGSYDIYTGQNIEEARRIVELICERRMNKVGERESIGVITMNTAQQYLIEDMLIEAYEKNKVLYQINKDMDEPIYITTISDSHMASRDVIYLSVLFGKENDGKCSMDFGTLSHICGENKLNVAVACARKELHVITSIQEEEIDLARTRATGVITLKKLLLFAKNKEPKINSDESNADQSLDDIAVFSNSIASELRKEGYEVDCNVGLSQNKIDIVILDPTNRNEYLLGIILYGLHVEDPTIANRDMLLNSEQLQNRNWKLYNIWFLDWLDNPSKVICKLRDWIDEHIEYKDEISLLEKDVAFEECMQEVAIADI